jgi:type III restriction enzyme
VQIARVIYEWLAEDKSPAGIPSAKISGFRNRNFEVIPFKANKQAAPAPQAKRYHVHSMPAKSGFEIHFPRVEGYTQEIRNRITVNWNTVPPLFLEPC